MAAVSRILALAAAATLASGVAFAQTTISVAPFNSVELRGGGHVTIRHGDAQRVTLIKGSTQFTHMHIEDGRKLVIDACNRDCPHEYDLDIEIVTPDIEGVAISGGGSIQSADAFPGQHSVSAAVEGGGAIDIRSIDADAANAAINGGGKIAIRAEHRLTAAVDGGGHIVYWGDPSVTSAIDGGGNISKGS
jgi:Putative auto-transporter adhesin, head GIN domain